MPLHFQSLLSGSSGNCLFLWSENTKIIFDAGFRSKRSFIEALGDNLSQLDGVVVSHLHGDHINFSAIKVLEERGIPLYVNRGDLKLLRNKFFNGLPFDRLKLKAFSDKCFIIGEFSIRPFVLPHAPGYTTFGFSVIYLQKGEKVKVVLASDLADGRGCIRMLAACDFLYLEANHDLHLLQLYPNLASRYHLSNNECGNLLVQILKTSGKYPSYVMLGHLSAVRNKPRIAKNTINKILKMSGYNSLKLYVAPQYRPSININIAY